MDYPFRLKGKAPVLVKGWGNIQIELLAALAGVKPVIQSWVWVEKGDEDALRRLCGAMGLRFLVHDRKQEEASGRQYIGVMLGRSPTRLAAAARSWDTPQFNPGVQLGYPACCTEFYVTRYFGRSRAEQSGEDLVSLIYKNTPAAKGAAPRRLPFLLNNVFYMYSRQWAAGDDRKRAALCALNPSLNLDVMNVIPWHPCSYRCPRSLSRARKIWSVMTRVAPEMAALLKAHLPRPILFWDWSRFAVLDGACSKDGCRYKGLLPPFTLLDEQTVAALKAGDTLVVEAERVVVRKGTRRIAALSGPAPILLDFL